MNEFMQKINALEDWFNLRFGWFFTNGNKDSMQ